MESKLIDLREHCFKLSDFLSKLDYYQYPLAIDWLYIASGVRHVEVFTAEFNDSIIMCGAAFDYENKRSKLLSELATRLTIFNFVWGSFESVAKAINLPSLSKSLRRQGYPNSVANRVIWFLKQNYNPMLRIASYDEEVKQLYELIESHGLYQNYLDELINLDLADHNGLGLHIVRKLRNDLAHGSTSMPEPEDWGGEQDKLLASERYQLDLIDTSTRILLLTIQLLLLVRIHQQGVVVECLLDEDGFSKETSAEVALHLLHVYPCPIDWKQPTLFS